MLVHTCLTLCQPNIMSNNTNAPYATITPSMLDALNVKTVLNTVFDLKGEVLDEVTSDIKSLIGKEKMESKLSGWKISDKGILSTKEGHKISLPVNNSAVILLKFAMQLHALAIAGEMVVTAELPKLCVDYITQKIERIAKRKAAEVAPATA